jgi:hypothetical protein
MGVDLELGLLVSPEVRRSRAGVPWGDRRTTFGQPWLCDADFGHGFWTPLAALVAGEWWLSHNVRLMTARTRARPLAIEGGELCGPNERPGRTDVHIHPGDCRAGQPVMEHQAMELTSPRDLSSRQRMPSRKAPRREYHLYHDICALGWDMSPIIPGARSTDTGPGDRRRRGGVLPGAWPARASRCS